MTNTDRVERIRERFPYGLWQRTDGTYFRAVWMDVTEGPKMNAQHAGDPRAQRYVSIEEAAKRLEPRDCPRCDGSGYHAETGDPCHLCVGRGTIPPDPELARLFE